MCYLINYNILVLNVCWYMFIIGVYGYRLLNVYLFIYLLYAGFIYYSKRERFSFDSILNAWFNICMYNVYYSML